MWEGDCFVFDNRVAVDHSLQKGDYEMCRACRHALTEEETQSEKYVEGISCPHCFDTLTEEQRIRAAERQKQVEISKALGRKHIGATVLEREQWREMKLEERKKANEKRGEE